MPPLSLGHCWLVQIEIVGGPLCQPVRSTCSEELLKVGVLYLPCAVAYNPNRNTGDPARDALLCFFFLQTGNKKKNHTLNKAEK